MNYKALVTGVMVTAMSVCALGARAGVKEDHDMLLYSLESLGVTVMFNAHACSVRDIDGLYNSKLGKLVICQDKAKWATDTRLAMTQNDYDTLRHEAHHVIQDCVNGKLGDGLLGDLFKDPVDYHEFVHSTLGPAAAAAVAETYSLAGASAETVSLEVEAFAIASSVPANVLSQTLVTVCRM